MKSKNLEKPDSDLLRKQKIASRIAEIPKNTAKSIEKRSRTITKTPQSNPSVWNASAGKK